MASLPLFLWQLSCAAFVVGFKQCFIYSAYRANPVIRNVFECGSWLNSAVEIAYFRIIDIAARHAYPFLHIIISVYVGNLFVKRVLQGGKATSSSFRVLPCRRNNISEAGKSSYFTGSEKSFQEERVAQKRECAVSGL